MTDLIILINELLFYVYFQAGLLTLMDTYLPAGVKQSDEEKKQLKGCLASQFYFEARPD